MEIKAYRSVYIARRGKKSRRRCWEFEITSSSICCFVPIVTSTLSSIIRLLISWALNAIIIRSSWHTNLFLGSYISLPSPPPPLPFETPRLSNFFKSSRICITKWRTKRERGKPINTPKKERRQKPCTYCHLLLHPHSHSSGRNGVFSYFYVDLSLASNWHVPRIVFLLGCYFRIGAMKRESNESPFKAARWPSSQSDD